ncbi:Plasmodium exported protein, unknown function, partial [Plasmodium vivax]
FGKSLENIYKQDKILDIKFNRLLAKHDIKRELEYTRLREKLPDISSYKSERNVYDNVSAYSGVKGKVSNHIDIYMKNYQKRYMRKKGLSKLDCYYENKLFGKFNRICDIGKKMQYNEKHSKMFFLKKYGLGLILFALIPVLGSIYLILFGINRKMPGILGPCTDGHFETSGDKFHKTTGGYKNCRSIWIERKSELIGNFECANFIFTIIMVSIVILFIFYILIKVIKYEKIKAGKGKMNMKEHCRFCKDIF